MDATTPFRRWLRAAGLLALTAGGCKTPESTPVKPLAQPIARPQAPADPLAPLAPGPTPPAAVVGQPVATGAVSPAGFSPAAVKPAAVLNGTPRIKVVAVVGAGNIVTDEEVWESVRQRGQEYINQVDGPGGPQVVKNAEKEKEIYAEVLRRTVERELVLDEMYARLKKAGKMAVVDDIKKFAGETADRQLREWRKGMKVQTDDDFRLILATQGLTLPVVRRQIERQVMAEEYVRSMMKEAGKKVGLADIRAYYDAHPDQFRTPDRVRWQGIFVALAAHPNPRAAYDHATKVRGQAAGGADFVALAKAEDPRAAGRQDWDGVGTKRGEIQPADVEEIVWLLKPGQVSELIQTPTGYHIVKVVERDVAAVRPFDEKTQAETRRALMRHLQEKEHRRLVDDLWRRGVVKIIDGA